VCCSHGCGCGGGCFEVRVDVGGGHCREWQWGVNPDVARGEFNSGEVVDGFFTTSTVRLMSCVLVVPEWLRLEVSPCYPCKCDYKAVVMFGTLNMGLIFCSSLMSINLTRVDSA
jgi:hypothetical protein